MKLGIRLIVFPAIVAFAWPAMSHSQAESTAEVTSEALTGIVYLTDRRMATIDGVPAQISVDAMLDESTGEIQGRGPPRDCGRD